MPETPDLAQAARLELAALALERRDLPALVGHLASLKAAPLDHLAEVADHPLWDVLAPLLASVRDGSA